MSKNKDRPRSSLRPEISKELDKIKLGKEKTEKLKKDSWVKEEKRLEEIQTAKIKDVQRKILKHEDYDKRKKASKKTGGVRGKFHPSLERTRKRT
jgi:hypothetical protein